MNESVEELVRVIEVVEQARVLLAREEKRLIEERGRPDVADVVAGGPGQTYAGVRQLASTAGETVRSLAGAIGYVAADMPTYAESAMKSARRAPSGGGASRMARPLTEDTVRALTMIRDTGFFTDDVVAGIDKALAATKATWPPADWDTYMAARKNGTAED